MRMTIELLSIASIVQGHSDPYFYAFGIEFRRRLGVRMFGNRFAGAGLIES